MSRSVADYDISRLTPAARDTLQTIAIPLSEGAKQDELAEQLGIGKRELTARMAALRQELDDQKDGATVRPMTQAEYEALRDSIGEVGQLVPAIVAPTGEILDGHNRARACAELGLELRTEPLADGHHAGAHNLELAINFVRRQLTAGDRRRAIAAELTRDPERSDRSIASTIGVSPTTVGGVRVELQQAGQLSNLDSRRSADGRTRPATQPAHASEKNSESRLDYIEQELLSLAALEDREHAHAQADTLLVEAVRILGGDRIAHAWENSGPRWYAR